MLRYDIFARNGTETEHCYQIGEQGCHRGEDMDVGQSHKPLHNKEYGNNHDTQEQEPRVVAVVINPSGGDGRQWLKDESRHHPEEDIGDNVAIFIDAQQTANGAPDTDGSQPYQHKKDKGHERGKEEVGTRGATLEISIIAIEVAKSFDHQEKGMTITLYKQII